MRVKIDNIKEGDIIEVMKMYIDDLSGPSTDFFIADIKSKDKQAIYCYTLQGKFGLWRSIDDVLKVYKKEDYPEYYL